LLSETLKQELARYGIGEKVRAMRWQRKMRLVELAKRTGLSPALLSKIERGNSVPSLPALCLIASAFEVKLSHFFPKPQHRPAAVTRRRERIRFPESMDVAEPAYEFECLNFPVSGPKIHCYRADFNKTAQPHFHAHEGLEFLYLTSGELSISLTTEEFTLKEGDSMYFDSGIPHSYQQLGGKPCAALVVTFPAVSRLGSSLDAEIASGALRLRTREIIWRRAS
jgi:transcriptional regulator with XRE-family HTH domain